MKAEVDDTDSVQLNKGYYCYIQCCLVTSLKYMNVRLMKSGNDCSCVV